MLLPDFVGIFYIVHIIILRHIKSRQGRTTIIVAHRLSTIKNADLVVGLDGGKVAEMGTHEELMEKQGIYYQLVMNQVRD